MQTIRDPVMEVHEAACLPVDKMKDDEPIMMQGYRFGIAPTLTRPDWDGPPLFLATEILGESSIHLALSSVLVPFNMTVPGALVSSIRRKVAQPVRADLSGDH